MKRATRSSADEKRGWGRRCGAGTRCHGPCRVAAPFVLAAALWLGLASAAFAATAPPLRVATLLPFVAEALAGVPAHAVVVASVRRNFTEPVPAGVADLGTPHAPSFEKLAESRPELVVAERGMHATLVEKLGRSGAEVLLIDTSSVESTFAGLVEVGTRVGAKAEIDREVADARAEIRAQALAEPLPALVLFGVPGAFLLVTERTWLGDLLGELNFKTAAPGASGRERFPGYAELSDEVLAGLRPEIVLLVAHGDPQAIRAALAKRIDEDGAWRSIREAARRGVHVLPGDIFAVNPGLAMAEAARELRRLAQPDVARAS